MKSEKLIFYILIFFIISPILSFSQISPMRKLENMKKMYDMGLLEKKEFDSISVVLKNQVIELMNRKPDGFYYDNKEIYPEKFTKKKVGKLNALLGYASAGVIPINAKAYILGLKSKNIVDKLPIKFELFISPLKDESGSSNIVFQQYFSNAKSPKDFILIKLDKNKHKNFRVVNIGKLSLFSEDYSGVKSDEFLPFDWFEIEKGKFVIETSLPPGEYAFLFTGNTQQEITESIYTFSVKNTLIKIEDDHLFDNKENKNNVLKLNDCGEKPRYKGSRQAGYQSKKAYKEYLKLLKLWNECTNQN